MPFHAPIMLIVRAARVAVDKLVSFFQRSRGAPPPVTPRSMPSACACACCIPRSPRRRLIPSPALPPPTVLQDATTAVGDESYFERCKSKHFIPKLPALLTNGGKRLVGAGPKLSPEEAAAWEARVAAALEEKRAAEAAAKAEKKQRRAERRADKGQGRAAQRERKAAQAEARRQARAAREASKAAQAAARKGAWQGALPPSA